MVHSQGIWIILCHFTNCPIIYPVVPVYYCPGHGISIQLNVYLCTTDVHVSHLPSPHLVGGEVNEYFLVEPNILRKPGFIFIIMFTI